MQSADEGGGASSVAELIGGDRAYSYIFAARPPGVFLVGLVGVSVALAAEDDDFSTIFS